MKRVFRLSPFAFRLLMNPFADQRGFAKAGGCGDEGQFAAYSETLIQPLDQARAWDHLRSRGRNVKFRG